MEEDSVGAIYPSHDPTHDVLRAESNPRPDRDKSHLMSRWTIIPLPRTRAAWFYGGLFVAWACIVLSTLAHHEFWRDEVRALSYVMDASSLADLARFMKDEGHPMLWHLLLYGSYQMVASKVVLPILSILIAGAAVFLFIFYAPFPWWLKALFVLSGLPLYEYSVMARNYGISMLLLFAFAWMYPWRKQSPLVLGIILALLCNTNIHSLILAGLLMGLWLWDMLSADSGALVRSEVCKLTGAFAIVVTGMAVALYTLWPSDNTVVSDATRYTTMHMLQAFAATVIHPAGEFRELFPNVVPLALANVILLGSLVGLMVRPAALVTAYTGVCALSVFFNVFYPGGYRHQGLLVIFLVCLYWIVFNEGAHLFQSTPVRRVFRAGAYGGLALLFAFLIVSGANKVAVDWLYQESASQAFQGFLKDHPEYTDAILIGEPDYLLEAVRYYADNRIYIVREKRFGHTVRFVRSAQLQLSLGDLLCAAWHVQTRENKPVLIALGHLTVGKPTEEPDAAPHAISYPYRRMFTWSKEELAAWRRYTTLQRQLTQNVVGDEMYAIYSVATPSHGPEPACYSAGYEGRPAQVAGEGN